MVNNIQNQNNNTHNFFSGIERGIKSGLRSMGRSLGCVSVPRPQAGAPRPAVHVRQVTHIHPPVRGHAQRSRPVAGRNIQVTITFVPSQRGGQPIRTVHFPDTPEPTTNASHPIQGRGKRRVVNRPANKEGHNLSKSAAVMSAFKNQPKFNPFSSEESDDDSSSSDSSDSTVKLTQDQNVLGLSQQSTDHQILKFVKTAGIAPLQQQKATSS